MTVLKDVRNGTEMSIYIVEFDWFDDIVEENLKPTKHYLFSDVENALEFVNRVIWSTDMYIKYGEPKSAYLFKIKEGAELDEDFGYRYTAGWLHLDEKHRGF